MLLFIISEAILIAFIKVSNVIWPGPVSLSPEDPVKSCLYRGVDRPWELSAPGPELSCLQT